MKMTLVKDLKGKLLACALSAKPYLIKTSSWEEQNFMFSLVVDVLAVLKRSVNTSVKEKLEQIKIWMYAGNIVLIPYPLSDLLKDSELLVYKMNLYNYLEDDECPPLLEMKNMEISDYEIETLKNLCKEYKIDLTFDKNSDKILLNKNDDLSKNEGNSQ